MIKRPRSRKVVGRSAYQTKTSLSIGRGIASRRRDLELSHSMRTKRKAIVIISWHLSLTYTAELARTLDVK